MARETNNFESMGYSRNMGKNMAGSISGTMTTKATHTDVDRDQKTLASYGVHGKGKDGMRHSKRKHAKKRK